MGNWPSSALKNGDECVLIGSGILKPKLDYLCALLFVLFLFVIATSVTYMSPVSKGHIF